MRQFQFPYQNEDKFVNSLRKINQWRQSAVSSTVFFQIYTSKLNRPKIETVCAMIEREMPDAYYMGSSAFGNIMMGDFTKDEITVVCSVFEYFTTKIKILQYPLTAESVGNVTSSLIEEVKNAPWCKCVMAYATIRGMSMTDFCNGLEGLPENVQFFGGGAFNIDINSHVSFRRQIIFRITRWLLLLSAAKTLMLHPHILRGGSPWEESFRLPVQRDRY